ncbi:hypothetical protein BXZ70DRAFT_1000367 [Cristinia sonorae]|uniref:FAD-binding PCMH-type domain-containing protein n=1 Tax=Cristinia sonorae TaxID=1940300 RepID=A0A8K0XQK0_9AGAR|nr:hypothetical protein BXZ70DRAFT_1000367 [Cristinia sonorae]
MSGKRVQDGQTSSDASGKGTYFMIMTATFILALSSNPFGVLDYILRTLPSSFSICRCLYGDPCWPSNSAFEALSEEISQPLLFPRPPASACYSSQSDDDCAAAVNGTTDGIWRSGHPGSMQNSNFETHVFPNGTISACYLNQTLGAPCEQGSIPVVGVDARSVKDVSAAVRFAAQNNLRLTIKNTGHDYLGRSTARGSFLLWTHNLKDIIYHESFIPAGGKEVHEHVITLGSGVQWFEAYDAVYKRGRVIAGGVSPGGSNGAAGGWIMGGGHSILSPKYGLGVDNVVQMTVVVSSGEHLTVNSHQYSDLFWALRGGGGGTYGVLTSVTYQTHPSTPIIGGYFGTTIDSPVKGPTPVLTKLVTELVRIFPKLADSGWAGYPTIEPDPVTQVPSLSFLLIAPNTSWARANETLNPFFAFAQTLAAGSSYEDGGALTVNAGFTMSLDSFNSWETAWFRKIGIVGNNVNLGSRLIPRETIEKKYAELGAAIADMPGAGFYLVGGGATSRIDPSSAAVNPAWRNALMHLVFWGVWSEGAPYEYIQMVDAFVKSHVDRLTAIVPDSGAYFNEAYMHEPNPQETFFGPHYTRLLSIKEKYDPRGLFIVAKGVGHEKWDESLNCRV